MTYITIKFFFNHYSVIAVCITIYSHKQKAWNYYAF